MSDLDSQVPYWDAAAATKTFTHPLHLPWLDGISRHAAILDYGCGYGRIMKELELHGFGDLTGVDASPAMISRARRLHPSMRFATLDAPLSSSCPDSDALPRSSRTTRASMSASCAAWTDLRA
ncbi:class I SAM-dependent methyltransferase [Streptomyces sp. NPDC001348]